MAKKLYSRRDLLVKGALAVPVMGFGAHAWAQDKKLTATPKQTEGPFYPRRKPADIDNDLAVLDGNSALAAGQLLTVQGRVLGMDGSPVTGARVEFWHCDMHGTYHHVGARGTMDNNFQGYGEMQTGSDGRYDFRTVKPGIYPGRACHIHFKVIVSGRPTLTSQMYFDTEMEANMKDGIYSRLSVAEREAVTIKTRNSGSFIDGRLDIVVA